MSIFSGFMEMAKKTLYDTLGVNSSAPIETISKAYKSCKEKLIKIDSSSEDVRNELIFLDEAFKTLSDPVLRQAYDQKLIAQSEADGQRQEYPGGNHIDEQSIFLRWWEGSKVSKVLIGVALVLVGIFFYKYQGEKERLRLEAQRILLENQKAALAAENEAKQLALENQRIENERLRSERQQILQQQVVNQQGRTQDRTLDIYSRREDRADRELEYRASATGTDLELRRQRQQWVQEQYEKDRQRREAEMVHLRNKQELCNIYRSNRQFRAAAAEGC